MLKSFLKFLLLSFFSFLMFIVVLVGLAALTMGPRVKENSVLFLELAGPLLEQGPRDWKERLLVGEVLTTRGVLNALEKAKKDSRIHALVVSSLWVRTGFARAQEVRAAVKDFAAESKKPVYGYVDNGGTIDYYICSAAPKVFMPPEGDSWFTLLGLRVEVPFLKGTLDKLGVEAQLDHIGTYKSGAEIYTREGISEPNREAINSLLDSFYSRLTTDIAKDRRLSVDQLKEAIDQAPFIGAELKKKALVDDLLYRDQLDDLIRKEARIREINRISALEYQKPTFSEAFDEKKNKIAIVYGTGTIMPGESASGWGEEFMGSTTMMEAFRKTREDDSIKAIVFRVDSPGGSPSASDLIWREVRLTAKKKPVVVSMADVAASGGYYVSMGATRILADPSTITGSIGVYGGKFYIKGLYDKIGLNKEIIKRGEHADLFSDYVPFSDEEWKIIRDHMRFTYEAFTRKAAEGRKKTQEQIYAVAEGRVWSGDQGVTIGLVDQIGGLKDAIREASKLAKLKDSEVGFVIYPEPKGGFGEIFSSIHSKTDLPADLKKLLLWAEIAQKEHLALLMPYTIQVN